MTQTIEITDEAYEKISDIKASMVESTTPSDVILYLAEVYQEVADHRLLPWMV